MALDMKGIKLVSGRVKPIENDFVGQYRPPQVHVSSESDVNVCIRMIKFREYAIVCFIIL